MSAVDSDSDDDLRRAIALSLLDVKPSPPHNEPAVIDLVSDDDTDDLDQPSVHHPHPEAMDGLTTSQLPERQGSSELNGVGTANGSSDPNLKISSELSIQESISQQVRTENSVKMSLPSTAKPPEISAAIPSPKNFLGLNRKKMEEERLARTRKRKASISPPPPRSRNTSVRILSPVAGQEEYRQPKRIMVQSNPPHMPSHQENDQGTFSVPSPLMESKPVGSSQSAEDEDPDLLEAIKASLMESLPTLSKAIPVSAESLSARISKSPEAKPSRAGGVRSYLQQRDLLTPGIHFPDGAVKKTWARGFPRIDDIKIEEVLQKGDLELAVLSAFQWDEEWILRKLDLRKTKLVCVVQAKEESQKAEMRANAPSFINFCFPSMEGQINCMHSKLQLLSHPTHLRVVVPSANLVPYDWGEDGGVMENVVFLIDLPRLPDGQTASVGELTPFGRELSRFLKAMGLDSKIIDSLLRFDFTRTSHLAFVHTIGGSHSGQSWKTTGHCGLGSAVTELGLASTEPVNVDFVSASIGSLSEAFIRTMYLAAKGDDGMIDYNWRNNKKSAVELSRELGVRDESQIQKEVHEKFRIYYPTHETVANSKGGIGGGGTICLNSNAYDSAQFPIDLMRDCKSKRAGLLMHNKMLFVRPTQMSPWQVSCNGESNPILAWAYVGSANLSESAWGRLVKDSKTKLPKLNCRNWECGVVVPVKAGRPVEGAGIDKGKDKNAEEESLMMGGVTMDVFGAVVPVPMVVPGEEYAGRRPWLRDEWRGGA